MNKVLFSLVSYFICSLFFTSIAHATVYNVTSSAPDATTVGSLNYILGIVNGAGSGVGPHVINITVKGTTYYGATLSKDNVTVTGPSCTPSTNSSLDLAGGPFTISGNGCIIKGLLLQGTALTVTGSNTQIYGCWFNLNNAGTAGQGSVSNACVTIQGANTIVGSKTCKNYFSGTGVGGSSVIYLDNTCTGTVISNNFIGYAADGTTILGAAANSIRFASTSIATGSRIDSNAIVSNTSDLVLLEGDFSSSFIRNNTIQKSSAGNGIRSLATSTMSNSVISGNTVNSNNQNGIYILGTANNLQITNNNIGATTARLAGTGLGNSAAGIRVEANTNALTLSGNVVLDNGIANDLASSSGIYVYANGVIMSNVTVSNNRIGVDINDTKKGNIFSGLYLEGASGSNNNFTAVVVSGNIIGDNGSNQADKKSHGIAFLNIGPAAATNLQILNNYVGVAPATDPTPNANIGNYGNGIEVASTVGFTASGNVIGFNKFATTRHPANDPFSGGGILVSGGSSTGIIKSNYIGVTSTGVNIGNVNPTNTEYPNQMAGITIQASSNITIGGTSGSDGNIIRNNNYGIQLINTTSTRSSAVTVLGNTISNQTSHGIYIPGANSNTIGGTTAGSANIITANGGSGIFVLSPSTPTAVVSDNNLISRNQIFCNTGQGIKLTYGANAGNNGQPAPVITSKVGTTISGTATAGAIIEIFADATTCPLACGTSGSDKREGKTYITSVTATGGNWTYTGSEVTTDSISATATVGSNTSEFSYCNILTICPTAAAGSNQSLACDVTSTTLAATAPGTGETGTWTVVPANAAITFSDIHSNTSTVSNLPTGTTTLRWTISKTGCPDDFKDITITVKVSVAATANASTTAVCSSSPTVTLTGSNPSPGTGLWTVVGGTATLTNPTSYNTASASITAGPATFRWTITNGTCPSFANTSAVTVTTAVTATASVNTTAVCSTSNTVNLTGNNPSPGTGAWTVTGGAATLTNPTSYNTATASVTTSPATFTWTTTNGPCISSASTSAVTVTTAVTATATANATSVCSTSPTVNLTGNNPSPGTGAWTVVGGAATLTNPTSYNTASASITTSPATFRWTTTNGPCSSNANTSAVTVTTAVTATASVNTTAVCSTSNTVTLTGNNPAPGTGAWTVAGGTATLTNPTSYNTATASVTAGPATFTWTTTNGPCSSNATTSAVTVTTAVTATANASATSVCSTSPTVNLTGNNPSPGTGAWTVVGGAATLTNPTSYNTASASITTSPATFRWTTTNGPCSSNANTSAVTVTTAVTATASVNTTAVCSTSNTVTLTGNNPAPGTGAWTVAGGTATLTNPTSYNTATASVTSGPATFTWTTTNGPCSSSANTSAVTVSTPVTASATATSNVCSSSPLVVLTGNNPSPGTGAWTVTGGTATFGNAANASTTATVTSGTSLTFIWTTTNGACITSANATTTVSSPVTATASSNKSAVCTSSPVVTLTGSNPSPGTGLWTVTGGTATYDNASSASATATITSGTSLTFTWTITNNACTTSASTTIITVSTPVSPVTATATSSVCSSSPVVSLTGSNPNPGTGLWTVAGGTVNFGNAAQESTTATVTSGTSLTFTWTVTNGPCISTATATTTVNAAVTSVAGPAQALCNTPTATLQGNNPTVGTGAWTVTSGTGLVTTPSAFNSDVTNLTIGGSSTFLWTVTNGSCVATSSVTITVSAPGTISAGADQEVCQTNIGTVTLVGTGTGVWTKLSGTGSATSPNSSTTGVTGLTVGATTTFRWTVSSGACSGTDDVSVTVDATPVGSAGSNQALCNQTVTNLSATGSGSWSNTSGTGVVTSPASNTTGVTGLTVGGSSTFTWTLTNGACNVPLNVIVTSSSPVTANGGSDVQVCNATTANLSATGTGAWTASATIGTGTVTTPSNASSSVTGLTVGSASVFQWIVTSGACADTNLVTVTSYSPAVASAGPDRSLCNTTTYTMMATGTGTWTKITGSGSVTTSTSPTTNVTGLTIGGTSVFEWKVTNGTCQATDSVTLSVSPGITADAGSAQTLCNTNTSTLNATAGTNGTWLASTDATITNLTDPHSAVTVINSPATLTWQIDGGGCVAATATVTLTSVTLAKPILDGIGLSAACSGSTYAYSINNIDAGATYNWSSNPSAGINITPATGTAVDVSATVSGKLLVFVSKSGCSDSASAVIKVVPGPPSGSSDTLRLATCLLTDYVLETPLFNGFPVGTWSSTGGTLTFTYNPADSTTSIGPILDNWSDTLMYTISNGCGPTTFAFILKVGGVFNGLEASGPSDTLCVTNARHLNALVTPAGNYTYYWVSNVNYNNPVIDNSVHIDSTTVPTYSVTPRGRNNIYFVYVVDKISQCRTAIDTAYIHAVEGQDLYVPNLITPNEDNMNDHWVLRDKTTGHEILPGSHFELYNRWGQRVFGMDNYDNRFKADHISDGIYYFNVKSGCGDKEYKGWLQILGNTNP